MSLFTKLGNEIASPVDAAGNPRAVENVDMQRWMTEVERATLAFQAGGGIIFPDLATANASLAYAQNQMAWVIGDPVPANNGVYRKIGASGSGSWARLGDLPISMIRLDNAGAGTADAIIAEPMLPLPTTPGAALLTVNILAANTSSVTLNGKPLRTNSGNEIAPGGLTAGSIHAFLDMGDHFRLLSDQASAAIQAAAEAARDAAMSAVPNAFPVDRVALKALDTNSITAAYLKEQGREGQFIWRTGDYSAEIAADPYEGIYIKADGVPASAGAWVRASASNGQPINLRWFQVVNDGSDQYAKVQSAIDLAPSGATIYMPCGFRHNTAFVVDKVLEFRGAGIKQTQIVSAPTISGFIITPDLSLNEIRFADFQLTQLGVPGTVGTSGIACVNTTLTTGAGFLRLDNIQVRGYGRNVNLEYCQLYQISRCRFSNGGYGIYTKRCVNGTISQTVCQLNSIWGIQINGDNGMQSFSCGQLMEQVTCVNNGAAEGGTGGNISIAYNEYFTINNCMIDVPNAGSGWGVLVVGCSRGNIIGNWVGASAGVGVEITTSTQINVTGNTIVSSQSYGLTLQSTTNCSLVGNIFFNNNNTDVLIYGGSASVRNNIVTGNHFLSTTADNSIQETAAFSTVYSNNIAAKGVALQPGSVRNNRLTATAVYNPPSLADGEGVTTTVTVPGAALGEIASASFTLDTQGLIISAWVSDADTVSVRFQNETGGVLDIGNGAIRAVVFKS